MNGREKILAALSYEGTNEIPVVICYEDIYIRDHWKDLTYCPWWFTVEPDIEKQLKWRNDVFPKISQDWFSLPTGYSKEDRANISISEGQGAVVLHNSKTGKNETINEPIIGGDSYTSVQKTVAPQSKEEIDRRIEALYNRNIDNMKTDGSCDLANSVKTGIGAGKLPLRHVPSPLYHCVYMWGYENFMTELFDEPGLIKYAADKFEEKNRKLITESAILGAEVLWIEECFLDAISPAMFETYNLPYMSRLISDIRAAGMKSIYYHCGDPKGKIELILKTNPDAVSFEEGKKGFQIDIQQVVELINKRCAVLGNLDAMWLLPYCTELELKNEINRQISAGRKNGGRFIMSIGSPVTPGTSVSKVKQYCDITRELGKI